MIKSVLFAFMFSGSVLALSSPAFAQSSPNTTETDQSEEDWRKSKKKGGTTSEDILDIFKNTRSTGIGNGRGYSPIDALPEESRRHLMKERAKRMAQAGSNEAVDVSYSPSDAAKTDSELEADEKAAWEKMAQGMNGTTDQAQGQGSGGQPGQGQQGQGQGGQSGGQQGQGQQGNGSSSGDSGSSRSVMRGGSAASVSDIMARIKGLQPGSTGQGQSPTRSSQTGSSQSGSSQTGSSQSGQGQQGQNGQSGSQQGQQDGMGSSSGSATSVSDIMADIKGLQQGSGSAGQGQSPTSSSQSGQGQQDQSKQGQNQGAQSQSGQAQSQGQSQQDSSAQSDAASDAQSQADAASQAAAQAQNQAQDASQQSSSQQDASSENADRIPEATSPLDRIKERHREQSNNTGRRSSASDFLKKKD